MMTIPVVKERPPITRNMSHCQTSSWTEGYCCVDCTSQGKLYAEVFKAAGWSSAASFGQPYLSHLGISEALSQQPLPLPWQFVCMLFIIWMYKAVTCFCCVSIIQMLIHVLWIFCIFSCLYCCNKLIAFRFKAMSFDPLVSVRFPCIPLEFPGFSNKKGGGGYFWGLEGFFH